ncbi:MAG TPA: winged helix-turn-helix domain-containing protein [Candidatus Nitrosotalea sp.]|nr:winged helix-turn-helix domain-containing protein [Candidatus Nitrosotalea sp.]
MSKQTYRIELEIIADILKAVIESGMDGKYITHIVRDVNLSHNMALQKLNKLMKAGIIKTTERERNKVFVITENGIKFFYELRDFNEIVQSIRLGNSIKL